MGRCLNAGPAGESGLGPEGNGYSQLFSRGELTWACAALRSLFVGLVEKLLCFFLRVCYFSRLGLAGIGFGVWVWAGVSPWFGLFVLGLVFIDKFRG